VTRWDHMTPAERRADSDRIVAAELAAQGIDPADVSPALLAKTARLLAGSSTREERSA
jgi:hypothetical protein